MFGTKRYRFRGLNPNVDIWKLHIDDWISIQEVMLGKYYTAKELKKVEKILSSGGIEIDVYTDFVLTESIKDDYESIQVRSFSASLVCDMTQTEPIEGLFNPEPTSHDVLEFFAFLKSKGVIFGPKSEGYYNWSEAIEDGRSRGILVHRQYSFYELSAGLIGVDNIEKYYCTFKLDTDGRAQIRQT